MNLIKVKCSSFSMPVMSFEESAKQFLLNSIDNIAKTYNVKPEVAFTRWVCENILDITDDQKIEDVLSISGSHDYGVDFFYHADVGDPDTQMICWGQIKFSEKLNHLVTLEEITKFGDTVKNLTEKPEPSNPVFKRKSDLFNSLGGKDATINKKMIFVVTGKLNTQAEAEFKTRSWKQKIENLRGPKIECEIITIDEILKLISAPSTEDLKIKFDGFVLDRIDNTTNKKTVVGYVKAKELVGIMKTHDEHMFKENPRESLSKSTPTNKAIAETLHDPKRKHQFWKLNNGITAVCESFEKQHGANPIEFKIKNFKVVNGRQTTASLLANENLLDNLVLVGLTIHETVDPEERNAISRSTNTQNPVKPVDLITNLEEMINLKIQCKDLFPDFYFERQTRGFPAAVKIDPTLKKRITKRRVLEKNPTARAYLAYSSDPNTAMISDFELFSSANPMYYNQVFQNRTIRELIVPHIFMSMLKNLLSIWTKEINNTHLREKEILNKTIVQYFVLKLIGDSMNTLSLQEQNLITEKMIKIFRSLGERDELPKSFKNIAESSFGNFMMLFNINKHTTWPKHILERINVPGYKMTEHDRPEDYDIMYQLKNHGDEILNTIRESKIALIEDGNVDGIKVKLLEFLKD